MTQTMKISPLAGKPAPAEILVNVARLVTAYYSEVPDPANPLQRVAFGTSGHRGSAFTKTFNEAHVLAISQAICLYRKQQGIDGPLFIGIDTHALSEPAFASALEVLAANGVEVMMSADGEYTPTPVGSPDWLMALSLRRRTIHRKMAASSTTRRTVVRRMALSPPGSKNRPMPFCKTACAVYSEFLSTRHVTLRLPTRTIF